MSLATGIRNSVRTIIENLGSTASLYSYSGAAKTENEEGEITAITWGSAVSIKIINSNHHALRRLLVNQGEENNEGDRVCLVKDTVTIAVRDKLVIGNDTYLIHEIKVTDPIQDIVLLRRIVLVKDELYT